MKQVEKERKKKEEVERKKKEDEMKIKGLQEKTKMERIAIDKKLKDFHAMQLMLISYSNYYFFL